MGHVDFPDSLCMILWVYIPCVIKDFYTCLCLLCWVLTVGSGLNEFPSLFWYQLVVGTSNCI